jgi:hypothetical protein
MAGVGFFVCGTPSNNRGFELVELGPEKLPGTPAAYLDKAPAEAAECHRVESIHVDGQRYVQYSRVLRINPNDAQANRGAYVAVGCVIRERLALHTVANCLDVVAELYGRLCSGLTADRSFPAGYRLADFETDRAPLEEKAAYQCSPLLVADVVLQALNAEGPIDWPNIREVLLAPEEMTATDVARYQLYSRQGALGSLASIDTDRANVQQTAQRATTAAQALVELQREWAALEGVAERLLMKGQAFQSLTLELERGVKRELAPEAARSRYGRTEATDIERAEHLGAPSPLRTQRGRVGRDAAFRRRNSAATPATWLPRAGWPRAVALVLLGGLVAVAAVVTGQKYLPNFAGEAVPPQAVVEPEQQQEGEEVPAQPESDVAKERAALDTLPKE